MVIAPLQFRLRHGQILWPLRTAESWCRPSYKENRLAVLPGDFSVGILRYDRNETLSIRLPLKHWSKPARRAASSASAPRRAGRPSGRVRRGNPTCVTVVNRLCGITVAMHFSNTEMVLMAPKLAPIATNAHRPTIPRAVLPLCSRRGTTICLGHVEPLRCRIPQKNELPAVRSRKLIALPSWLSYCPRNGFSASQRSSDRVRPMSWRM
jgi:hypothetical protein